MKYLSNISRIHNCWNRFAIEYVVWNIFLCHFFHAANNWKLRNYPREKILGPKKILTRKCFRLMKCTREKILDPQNTYEKKFGTHEIPTRKYSEPTKYPGRHDGTRPTRPTTVRDPRNLAHSISFTSNRNSSCCRICHVWKANTNRDWYAPKKPFASDNSNFHYWTNANTNWCT